MERQHTDLIGKRFGRLTVIAFDSIFIPNCSTNWKVKCDCGIEFIANRANLVSGATKSCGCLRSEMMRRRNLQRYKESTMKK